MNAEELVIPTWLKRNALVEYFHRIDDHATMALIEHLNDAAVERVHTAMTNALLNRQASATGAHPPANDDDCGAIICIRPKQPLSPSAVAEFCGKHRRLHEQYVSGRMGDMALD